MPGDDKCYGEKRGGRGTSECQGWLARRSGKVAFEQNPVGGREPLQRKLGGEHSRQKEQSAKALRQDCAGVF